MWITQKVMDCWRERRLPSIVQVPMLRFWRSVSPWQRRYGTEADFWDEHIDRIRHLDVDALQRVFPQELTKFASDYFSKNARPPDVLEVGSGPLSLLSAGVAKGLIRVVAVDPLALVYKRIARKRRWQPVIQPVLGTGEHLDLLFPAESFDAVYASNALDHAAIPRHCLEQMIRVLRPGGILMIEGYIREGSIEGWVGLHQFDLVPEGESLACYRKDGSRENLTDHLGLICRKSEVKNGEDRRNGTVGLIREGWGNWLAMVFEKGAQLT